MGSDTVAVSHMHAWWMLVIDMFGGGSNMVWSWRRPQCWWVALDLLLDVASCTCVAR
jgi:hypothetical protein